MYSLSKTKPEKGNINLGLSQKPLRLVKIKQ